MPNLLSFVVGMTYIVAYHRLFTANFTYSGHRVTSILNSMAGFLKDFPLNCKYFIAIPGQLYSGVTLVAFPTYSQDKFQRSSQQSSQQKAAKSYAG
jgi:hypothetical protein